MQVGTLLLDVGEQEWVDDRDVGAVADDVRTMLAGMTFPLEYHAELVGEMLTDAGSKHGNPANVTILASSDVHAKGGPGEILVPGRDPVPVPVEVEPGPVEVQVFGDIDRNQTIEALSRTFGALKPRAVAVVTTAEERAVLDAIEHPERATIPLD